MPNLDGGHYFLTVLAPVSEESSIDQITGRSRSHRQLLQQKLAMLDTGQQTEVSPPNAASPFAGNTLNHFVRFVIIDGPNFNGRISGDSLVSAVVTHVDPLKAQPVDRLGSPFLLFAADIDAPGDGAAALRAYTDRLWATIEPHLRDIFGHCIGFSGVASADAFHDYITRCQVETTMPFNDYWADGLNVKGEAPLIATLKRGAIGLALALVLAAALGSLTLAVLLAAPIALYLAYRAVLRYGAAPFPIAAGADLASVLKSLFVQQNFTRFASQAQGLSDAELFARFGAFVDAVRPAEAAPAQAPGAIRAPQAEWGQ